MKNTCHRTLPSFLVLLASFLAVMVPSLLPATETPVKIGVLATRGEAQCLKNWAPTADYLSQNIPGFAFTVVPLPHDHVTSSVREGAVDFILTNSALYVELEQLYGASRIATMKELRLGRSYSQYGSVIFTRANRMDIRTLADFKGRSFMGVDEASLGGWQMAWREFQERGIDPRHDFASLTFGTTHDEVVYAVRDGLVDGGTVRTNTLELLAAEGKIALADFFILPQLTPSDQPSPYFVTTREYPDWPMAKVTKTPDELAEKVAVALLQMTHDSPAARAAECAGWTIPHNYQPVRELMIELRIGPYRELGRVTMGDLIRTYGPWLVVAFIFFCTHTAFTFLVVKLNRRLRAVHISLRQEIELHKKLDKELEQAKEQAEAATLAKSQFLANMSHEIRTPMNGIIAATDLALAEPVSHEVEHYLQIVQNSSFTLLGIINDILDFSKIEAGQLELRERLFRLDEMFDQVMDVFVNQTAEKGIELLVDVDADTPRLLLGDSQRLQQILTNLIGNAIKFTNTGGVILVSVHDATRDGEHLEKDQVILSFSVKDTGTGISPDYLPSLFEPFSQGDSSSTRKYEGTGLGLSICRRFVTMMHGTIGVESVLGEGSTFTFTVRLVKAGDTPVRALDIPADISGLNVLVVDDCRDSRTIMARMLTSLDFKVETVSSGAEAIERLTAGQASRNTVDLVLMDWKMEGMNGIETSRKIRKKLNLSIPIIMMTAFAREVRRSEAEEAGTNGFLTKPIFQSTLFDAIMDAFGREGTRKTGEKVDFTTRASIYKKHLRGCRILVAEDNHTNQQVARAILEGAGIHVTIVINGEEAVEKVTTEQFDGVLMDVQMPKMNGYAATRAIRALPGCKKLPIIAMTAHAMKGDEERCLEAGMDGYVAKPINQDRLFYTLWHHLRSRKRLHTETKPKIEMVSDLSTIPDTPSYGPEPVPNLNGRPAGSITPPKIPGIDIEQVLQTTGIDWPTFREIMVGFYHDNRDTVRLLQLAQNDHNLESIQAFAHSLKGSSGNIGASDLQQAAKALENGCTGNISPEMILDLCQRVQKELERLLSFLEPLTTHDNHTIGQEKPQVALDPTPLLAALTEAIDRADPEEIREKTEILQNAFGGGDVLPRQLLDELVRQLNRYDYEEAALTIDLIRARKEEHV
ncbi:hybrid sensor histidine kinase/response regulator [Desulfopila aestuarii]|uniref:Sensory/regulatory protein RpfC n=1 Tax=Desulfopila aestuarii DSM 18488 TaxID=1121416 RepID=A0A1M7YF86_9BACT|nr:response regulator [Desulfopila aestuarii]SHO51304.1 Signal transduction histidine kinase [Desulfopila aestuarii DSM 18488]